MSTAESLFKESRHFISCYDDKKNKKYALQNLRKIARYLLSQGYGVIYGAEEFQEDNVHAQDLLAKKIINAKEFSPGSNEQFDKKESIQSFRQHLLLINPESIRYGANGSWGIVDHWLSEYSRAEMIFAKVNIKPKRIIGISNPSPNITINPLLIVKLIAIPVDNICKSFSDCIEISKKGLNE